MSDKLTGRPCSAWTVEQELDFWVAPYFAPDPIGEDLYVRSLRCALKLAADDLFYQNCILIDLCEHRDHQERLVYDALCEEDARVWDAHRYVSGVVVCVTDDTWRTL